MMYDDYDQKEINEYILRISSKDKETPIIKRKFDGRKARFFGRVKNIIPFCRQYGLEYGKYYVYVLACDSRKFYVGQTLRIQERLYEHFVKDDEHPSSKWTNLYKPMSIIEIIKLNEKDNPLFVEDMITMLYMAYYGIPNVRGGHFCTPSTKYMENRLRLENFFIQNYRPVINRGHYIRYARPLKNDFRERVYVDTKYHINYETVVDFCKYIGAYEK